MARLTAAFAPSNNVITFPNEATKLNIKEMLATAPYFTRPGYNVEQTIVSIKSMIKRGREKFKKQNPALSTRYISRIGGGGQQVRPGDILNMDKVHGLRPVAG